MTKLQLFNYAFQFTGFRVCRLISSDGQQYDWGILGPVLPLTGWSTPYVGWPKVRFPRGH